MSRIMGEPIDVVKIPELNSRISYQDTRIGPLIPMNLSTSRKWGRLARVARDRNPQWAVGRLLNQRLRDLGLTPEDAADRTGIAKSTIYVALKAGHMNARNLAVMRRELGIPFDVLEVALLDDFAATTDPQDDLAELRDRLQELVDDSGDEEGSG